MHAIMHKEMQAQNMEIVVDDEPPTPGTGVMATAAAAAVAAVGGKLYTFVMDLCLCKAGFSRD
jgi:formiminotetrahydrofolate cyclodeaminase